MTKNVGPKTDLSIIVPVYNVDPYLTECLDSIQRQSFTAWECWLVDDGSTDFSGIICDSYARRDSRFKVIHQENNGVSAARNAGIDAATGELLSFIDPDDFISDNYFQELISEMERIRAEVSFATYFSTEESGNEGAYKFLNKIVKEIGKFRKIEKVSNKEVTDALCRNEFSCVSWGKVFSRELWGAARFPVGIDLGEDMMTIPAVIVKAQKAVYAQDAVYYYRTREKSLLHGTVTKDRYLKDLQASAEMVRQLEEHTPNRKEDFLILKMMYDIGCFANYIKSGNAERRKGSILFNVYEIAQDDGIEPLKSAGKTFWRGRHN